MVIAQNIGSENTIFRNFDYPKKGTISYNLQQKNAYSYITVWK